MFPFGALSQLPFRFLTSEDPVLRYLILSIDWTGSWYPNATRVFHWAIGCPRIDIVKLNLAMQKPLSEFNPL